MIITDDEALAGARSYLIDQAKDDHWSTYPARSASTPAVQPTRGARRRSARRLGEFRLPTAKRRIAATYVRGSGAFRERHTPEGGMARSSTALTPIQVDEAIMEATVARSGSGRLEAGIQVSPFGSRCIVRPRLKCKGVQLRGAPTFCMVAPQLHCR